MRIHRMQLPREVIVGRNVIKQTGEICELLGNFEKALVVTGPTVYKIIYQIFQESLEEKKIALDFIIIGDSTIDSVNRVVKHIKKIEPKIIFGIGGGKDTDIGKLSSAKCNLPFVSIPTAASHDGIASAYASIKGLKKPFSIKAQAPVAIIADIDLIIDAPYRLTASGCGDIIAKYSAVTDWNLANRLIQEYYGDYAANLALMSAKLVMKNAEAIRKKEYNAIHTIVEALISCGVAMSIAGSSRPCSGSEHLFAHALDLIKPNNALHGEKCAVGAILSTYLQNKKWANIRKILQIIGTPTNAKELGVSSKDVIKALITAHKIRPDRFTIFNLKRLNKSSAEILAKATKVID